MKLSSEMLKRKLENLFKSMEEAKAVFLIM
nr:MAG TPA: hypothetical protein [Caudoviricetes sp.]